MAACYFQLWDYPMCPGNKTIKCALGMVLANVPSEWG